MYFRINFILLIICIWIYPVHSQGIRGKIVNDQGYAVPYANIYIPELTTGTSSNYDGNYELKLPKGSWKVMFQYIGYKTLTVEVIVDEDFRVVDVELEFQNYMLPEFKVMASGEDPAYYIMRKAIALAPYYRKQVSKYSCKVYLKGSGVFEKIPFMLEKQMKKDGVKENEAFVLETLSQIDFELPDKVRQTVLAMRSSGQDNQTSPMEMITNNLYDADKYGVISPVGNNAMKVYQFRLEGVFVDQGRTINKIRVIPKTDGNDVFSGIIYIADGFWNIHSADLSLHMPMTDAKVHQVYAEVNKNTWMPVALDFDMDFSGLGFKIKFNYVASVTDYKSTLNPALDHSFLNHINELQAAELEILNNLKPTEPGSKNVSVKSKAQRQIDDLIDKPSLSNRETQKLSRLIETEAARNSPPEPLEIESVIKVSQKKVNNDSTYWAKIRPIPLTAIERVSFAEKDTFLKASSTPEYQDSLRDEKRKFKAKHLVLGKTYDYSVDSIRKFSRFTIPNLTAPGSLSFNSVDGVRIELPFNYYHSDTTGKMLSISPTLAYTFARTKLDAELTLLRRFNGMTNCLLSFRIGTSTRDFNQTSGLSSLNNGFYTLWLEENYNRYYRKDFVQIAGSRDLVNGLNLRVTLDYNNNMQLSNHSSFTIIDYDDKEIQPNIPINNTLNPWQLENHQSLTSLIGLEYTPRYRYRLIDNHKVYVESRYPTFTMTYQGAYTGALGSDSRFDLLKLGIHQSISFGISDQFSYSLNTGAFLNSHKVFFENFEHFNTRSIEFMFSTFENSFRLLPFYTYSTSQEFIDGHANWAARRLLIKYLPLIKNISATENLMLSFLSTPELPVYVETGYGIHNLFLLFNIEVFAGFQDFRYNSTGLRISMNLK